jgi:hypothetical protein
MGATESIFVFVYALVRREDLHGLHTGLGFGAAIGETRTGYVALLSRPSTAE